MATYKVLQDIEADDKLLGPLSLKQFIFAIVFLGCGYIAFLLLTRGLGILSIFFVPPMVVTGFLAWPWSREQTTEVWLLAKVRFHIKPRRRIWNQSGISDVVTITAPPKLDKNLTDGLSEGDVRSRLQALANTIDSRGWAIKNVNVNLAAGPGQTAMMTSDRLIDVSALPQQVVNGEVSAADDILDERNNPTAQNLDRMINAKSASAKDRLMKRLRTPKEEPVAPQQPTADYWFLNQQQAAAPAGKAMFDSGPTIRPEDPGQAPLADPTTPAPTPVSLTNMHTVQPLGATPPAVPEPPKPSPKTPDPAILELASNNDLNVATLSRQAKKNKGELDDGEVVVPLR